MNLWPFGKKDEQSSNSTTLEKPGTGSELKSKFSHLFNSKSPNNPDNFPEAQPEQVGQEQYHHELSENTQETFQADNQAPTGNPSFGKAIHDQAVPTPQDAPSFSIDATQDWNTGSTFGVDLPEGENAQATQLEPQADSNFNQAGFETPLEPQAINSPVEETIIFEEPASKVELITDDLAPQASASSSEAPVFNEAPTFETAIDDLAPPMFDQPLDTGLNSELNPQLETSVEAEPVIFEEPEAKADLLPDTSYQESELSPQDLTVPEMPTFEEETLAPPVYSADAVSIESTTEPMVTDNLVPPSFDEQLDPLATAGNIDPLTVQEAPSLEAPSLEVPNLESPHLEVPNLDISTTETTTPETTNWTSTNVQPLPTDATMAPPDLELNSIEMPDFDVSTNTVDTDITAEIHSDSAETQPVEAIAEEFAAVNTDFNTSVEDPRTEAPTAETMNNNEQYMAEVLVDKNLDWNTQLLASNTVPEELYLGTEQPEALDPLLQAAPVTAPNIRRASDSEIDPLLQVANIPDVNQWGAEPLETTTPEASFEEETAIPVHHDSDESFAEPEFTAPAIEATPVVEDIVSLEEITPATETSYETNDEQVIEPTQEQSCVEAIMLDSPSDFLAPELPVTEETDTETVPELEADLETDLKSDLDNALENNVIEVDETIDEELAETIDEDDTHHQAGPSKELVAFTGSQDEFAEMDQSILLRESRYTNDRINALVDGYFGNQHSA